MADRSTNIVKDFCKWRNRDGPNNLGNDFLTKVWSQIYLCLEGTTAISRWLSAATPPDIGTNQVLHPGRMQDLVVNSIQACLLQSSLSSPKSSFAPYFIRSSLRDDAIIRDADRWRRFAQPRVYGFKSLRDKDTGASRSQPMSIVTCIARHSFFPSVPVFSMNNHSLS